MPEIKKKANKRPWQPERKAFGGRATDNTKFYQSAQWRKLRKLFLMENPLCAECLKKGKYTPADVVDHIIPITQGGASLDCNNLQALCSSCHNKKSSSECRHGK